MKRVVIINGPNLNLLGVREPHVYGNASFDSYLEKLRKDFPTTEIDYYQTNIEGEIVDALQKYGFQDCGIVLNAAAYSHTSVAILDAIQAIQAPVVEVHISNIYSRESFRHHSMLSAACVGTICGFGLQSYKLAIEALLDEYNHTDR